MSKLKEEILKAEKEGNVVFMMHEGPHIANLEDFISQPSEGILYDLNRDRVTVLSFIDDPKWINDFAVGLVIRRLKEKLEKLEKRVSVK